MQCSPGLMVGGRIHYAGLELLLMVYKAPGVLIIMKEALTPTEVQARVILPNKRHNVMYHACTRPLETFYMRGRFESSV